MMDQNQTRFQNAKPPYLSKMESLLSSLSELGQRHGASIRPFCEPPLARLSSVPEPAHEAIYQGFRGYFDILSSAELEGIDIENDSPRTAWWAFKSMGLVPPSDFFAYVEKDDVVEVYNEDFVQIFRTLNMFHLISYSLEELSTYEWWQLFQRDDSISREMARMARDLFSGRVRTIIHSDIPDHEVEEIFSAFKYKNRVHHKFIAPLFNKDGEVAAIASVFRKVESSS